ncbi:hypothetical protein ACFLXH_04640 [Chloroflexota bacterium]
MPCRGNPDYINGNRKEVKGMGKGGKGSGGRMTSKAASRVQSASAKAGGGKVSKGSFASRAQSSAARNSGK